MFVVVGGDCIIIHMSVSSRQNWLSIDAPGFNTLQGDSVNQVDLFLFGYGMLCNMSKNPIVF